MKTRPSDAPRFSFLALLTASLALAACDDAGLNGPSDLPPAPDGQVQFSTTITLPEFEGAVDAAVSRVEIKLVPGQLVAREVEIESADEVFDDEKLESRIADILTSNGVGQLELTLGGLLVDFDGTTSFEGFDGEHLSFDDFVASVRAELDAGRNPGIEAKRPSPAVPQDPSDASFFATKLELENGDDDAKLELNVSGDHLRDNAAPPPDAWLDVLGLAIELQVGSGVTELEREDDDVDGEVKFRDMVQSVDLVDSTFTLTNGDLVRVVAGTDIEGQGDDGLESLEAVDAALAQGLPVRAKGEAVVEQTSPRILIAVEVKFKVQDDDDDDDDDSHEDDLSLADFRAILEAGPTWIEIDLWPGQLVARRVEVQSDDEDEDKIEGRVAGLSTGTGTGQLELVLGGLLVDFDGTTSFENAAGQDISFDDFVATVQAELDAGRQPRIEAERPAAASPQAPDDASFLAAKLELDDGHDETTIEIRVAVDHLSDNATPPPDAWLTVLDLAIELQVSTGGTKLERDE